MAGLPTESVLKHIGLSKTDQKEGSRESMGQPSETALAIGRLLFETFQWTLCTPHSGQQGKLWVAADLGKPVVYSF